MTVANCGASKINGVFGTEVAADTPFDLSTKIIIQNTTSSTREMGPILLFVAGMEVARFNTLGLFPGESTELRLEGRVSALPAGKYDIIAQDNMGSEVCQTLTVGTPFDPRLVTVSGCVSSPNQIGEGDLVEFSTHIENDNDSPAVVDISWVSGGSAIITQNGIEVPAMDSRTVTQSATWSFVESRIGTGTFDVSAELSSIAEATLLAAALRGTTAGVDRRTLAVAGAGAGAGLAGLLARR